jgi:aryl-alcohol dehydrogenase-like predicted oxidoreductase
VKRRTLGTQGLEVSALGLGCMGMTGAYGASDEAEAIATIHETLDLGIDLIDTAEFYGPYENERLLGRALHGRRDRAVIATKFGFTVGGDGKPFGLDSRPEHIKDVCDQSLSRLGVEHIDLFYQHRVDPNVPIEDVIGAMAELRSAGKIRFIGLCEASPRTIERAHAVHPLSAVQSEYSIWERKVEHEVLPTCRRLGIGFVPYCPLGRGLLTGTIDARTQWGPGDQRGSFLPRFQQANLQQNLASVAAVKELAARKSRTPAQVALAWLLHQWDCIVPIPGTKRRKYLQENAVATEVQLEVAEMAWLNERIPANAAFGDRYNATVTATLDQT